MGHDADGMPDTTSQPQARQDEGDARLTRDGMGQAGLGGRCQPMRSGYCMDMNYV